MQCALRLAALIRDGHDTQCKELPSIERIDFCHCIVMLSKNAEERPYRCPFIFERVAVWEMDDDACASNKHRLGSFFSSYPMLFAERGAPRLAERGELLEGATLDDDDLGLQHRGIHREQSNQIEK